MPNCVRCNRRLKKGRWIYSTFTHERYCYPGEGCQRKARSKKARA
jgi:hypothetical protein